MWAEKVATAKAVLGTDVRNWLGLPVFIAVEQMTEAQLAELVEQAASDAVVFEYLRSWLAGDLGHAFPNPAPAPLVGFLQDLVRGRIPPPGNAKRELSRDLLRQCVAEIKANHGGTVLDAIKATAEAAGCKTETIRKIYYRKGE